MTVPIPGTAGRSFDFQQTSMGPGSELQPAVAPEADANKSSRVPELLTSMVWAYPALESLIQQSHRIDIQNLSRTNRDVHAILAASGVSPRGDSKLWASCPKMYECFWCNMPMCQQCGRNKKVTIEEIEEAIASRGPSTVPLCPHRFDPLKVIEQERLWRVPVCSNCLDKTWGDWIDTADRMPRCIACREPWGQQPAPPLRPVDDN